MTRVEEIVEQVRALTPDEQDEVRMLLNGAAEDGEFELSPEWEAEIARRIDDIESGRAKTIPWEQVQQELRERIRAHTD